eukprot:scaffold82470_cov30-Prasinocladus_malaysianus.AAC.1
MASLPTGLRLGITGKRGHVFEQTGSVNDVTRATAMSRLILIITLTRKSRDSWRIKARMYGVNLLQTSSGATHPCHCQLLNSNAVFSY